MKNFILYIKYLFEGSAVSENLARALKRKKRAYWEKVDYDSWHRTLGGAFQDEVERRAFEKMPLRRGGIAIDVGVGTGRMLEYLQGDVVGCDLSLSILGAARSRARSLGMTFFPVVADSSSLPFRRGRFSLVVSCRMLQHALDWRATLREMARLVGQGEEIVLLLYNSFSGYGFLRNLIAAYHNFRNWKAVKEGAEPPFEYFGHFNNPFDIRKELVRLGFSVEEVRGAGLFPVEVFPESVLKFLMPVARSMEPLAGIFPFSRVSGRMVVRARKREA